MAKTYDGQTARFLASVATCMPPLSGDVMQGWIDNPKALKKYLSGFDSPTSEDGKVYTFLAPHEKFIVGPLTKSFSPHKFFKTGDDLWVSDEFAERILSVAKVVKPGEAVSLRSFNLMREASDSDIRTEFPEEGLTELWQIAELIRYQSNGEEGRLLNNEYANIFYVRGKGGEVFAVRVSWRGHDRRWFVSAWRLVECDRWGAGRRVFSRN